MNAKYRDRHGVVQPHWTEAEFWADLERHRKELDPTSETPMEKLRRQRKESRRAAADANVRTRFARPLAPAVPAFRDTAQTDLVTAVRRLAKKIREPSARKGTITLPSGTFNVTIRQTR